MPDLRGLGDEVLPGATYDKKTMTSDIRALGGDHNAGMLAAAHLRGLAKHVKEIVIRDCGHWLLQEAPDQVLRALLDFFA